MDQQRLYMIDAVTRTDAKNARDARLLSAAQLTAQEYSPQAAERLYSAMLAPTTPLMAYILQQLPEGVTISDLTDRYHLSKSTLSRLASGDTRPGEDTLHALSQALHLDEKSRNELFLIARKQHTRFDSVMHCCLDFAVYDPVYINEMLARWLTEKAFLYTQEDIDLYDRFESDYRDWCLLITRSDKTPLTPEEAAVKQTLDKCAEELQQVRTELVRFILARLRAPMRPGHFRLHCTLQKKAWENLNDPHIIPRSKTLWKVAVGLQLSSENCRSMFLLCYETDNQEVRKA